MFLVREKADSVGNHSAEYFFLGVPYDIRQMYIIEFTLLSNRIKWWSFLTVQNVQRQNIFQSQLLNFDTLTNIKLISQYCLNHIG